MSIMYQKPTRASFLNRIERYNTQIKKVKLSMNTT